jgi:hypothetical protein
VLAALEQGLKDGKWYGPFDKLDPGDTRDRFVAQVAVCRDAGGSCNVTVAHYATGRAHAAGTGNAATQQF